MKVAIITRSTLYSVPGGDTIQAIETARYLNDMGIIVELKLSNETINYDEYSLLHFFNLIRPADILYHSKKAAKPFVISTILVDYSEYDKHYRKGPGSLLGYFSADNIEYIKTMARWVLGRDHLSSLSYIWKGQRKSILEILSKANRILPNSESEYQRVMGFYPSKVNYSVVPNGVDAMRFNYNQNIKKDDLLVICVARIEGIKNQLNLIRALNNTQYKLLLIGGHSQNQQTYYDECRRIAAPNINFINHLPQDDLVAYYQQAKVHVLPSWFETTGLSSVEAAVMGCNIVITAKGDTREYFEDDAFYCDPAQPVSILTAIEKAAGAHFNEHLRQRILTKYTWANAAGQTFKAYQTAIA
jgi:glycosyltransferase involved in cell wall biosynthesis